MHDPVVTINNKAPRTAIENIRAPIGATSAIYKKNRMPMIPFILGEAFLYYLECKLFDTMLNIVLKASAIITYNDSSFVYCISMCISFWSFSIPVPVQPISPFLPGPENSLQIKETAPKHQDWQSCGWSEFCSSSLASPSSPQPQPQFKGPKLNI